MRPGARGARPDPTTYAIHCGDINSTSSSAREDRRGSRSRTVVQCPEKQKRRPVRIGWAAWPEALRASWSPPVPAGLDVRVPGQTHSGHGEIAARRVPLRD
jgi:hypothetical protein